MARPLDGLARVWVVGAPGTLHPAQTIAHAVWPCVESAERAATNGAASPAERMSFRSPRTHALKTKRATRSP